MANNAGIYDLSVFSPGEAYVSPCLTVSNLASPADVTGQLSPGLRVLRRELITVVPYEECQTNVYEWFRCVADGADSVEPAMSSVLPDRSPPFPFYSHTEGNHDI
jgi:hypothetical protein